jgi:hypothetical protein
MQQAAVNAGDASSLRLVTGSPRAMRWPSKGQASFAEDGPGVDL